jgi:hypothetical protein
MAILEMAMGAWALHGPTKMISAETTRDLYRVNVEYVRFGLGSSKIETLAAVVFCSCFGLLSPLVDTSSNITALQAQT